MEGPKCKIEKISGTHLREARSALLMLHLDEMKDVVVCH